MAILAIALLIPACGGSEDGERAYREGRFAEAHAAFARESNGDDASPELLVNRALAALRAGDVEDAVTSAERAAARGGPEFAGLGDFLLGNAAFARCETAEQQARTPEAEPFAFDVAIQYAMAADDAWRRAAKSRADWRSARRNVERAFLMLQSLARQKAEKRGERRTESAPKPRILIRPPEARGAESEEDAALAAQKNELSPAQVLALLDKLNEKEKEKRKIRRTHRRERMSQVEKDW